MNFNSNIIFSLLLNTHLGGFLIYFFFFAFLSRLSFRFTLIIFLIGFGILFIGTEFEPNILNFIEEKLKFVPTIYELKDIIISKYNILVNK